MATVPNTRSRAAAPVLCSHGRAGYCHDDATPAEREALAFLHSHAYAYALQGGDHDRAERYATHYAEDNYLTYAEDGGAPGHRAELERWLNTHTCPVCGDRFTLAPGVALTRGSRPCGWSH